jgi:hypothetical protein
VNGCIVSPLSARTGKHGQYVAKGYAKPDGTRSVTTHHRWVYSQHHGIALPDMKGLEVCHSCDNTLCVNVDHLWLDTPQGNSDDKVSKGRQARGETSMSKLSWEDVTEIRSAYAAGGTTYRKLAAEYGMTDSGIGHIVRGARWAYQN